MNTQNQPQDADPARMSTARDLLLRVWLGMLVFGVINLPLIMIVQSLVSAPTQSTTPGLAGAGLFALLVGVIAALPALFFGWRSSGWRAFAAGVLAGYVLMTIVSSGACTLFTNSVGYEALAALFLYPLALIVFIVALGIAGFVAARRNR